MTYIVSSGALNFTPTNQQYPDVIFTVTGKLFFKFLPKTREPLHSEARWTLPILPIPLLPHWFFYLLRRHKTNSIIEKHLHCGSINSRPRLYFHITSTDIGHYRQFLVKIIYEDCNVCSYRLRIFFIYITRYQLELIL